MKKPIRTNNWINWLLHTLVMLRFPLVLLGIILLLAQDAVRFFLVLLIAVLLDSLAAMIKQVSSAAADVPGIDAERLRTISDYILYAVMPAAALVFFNLVPLTLSWLAVLPLLGGAFRLSKIHSGWHTNLPWVITLFYLYVLPLSVWSIVVVLLLMTGVSLFVDTKLALWDNPKTALVAVMWMTVALALLRHPQAATFQQIAWQSLLYMLSLLTLARVKQLNQKKVILLHSEPAEAG